MWWYPPDAPTLEADDEFVRVGKRGMPPGLGEADSRPGDGECGEEAAEGVPLGVCGCRSADLRPVGAGIGMWLGLSDIVYIVW